MSRLPPFSQFRRLFQPHAHPTTANVATARLAQLPKYTDPEEQELTDEITVALPSLNFAYQEAERLIDLQGKQIDMLDTKAQVSVGLIGVVAAALYSNLHNLTQMKVVSWTPLALTAGSVLLATAGILALWSYRVRNWSTVPDIERMQHYLTWDEAITKYVLINTMKEVFDDNARHAAEKARLLSWVQRLFLVAAIIFLGTYLLNVLIPPSP